MLRLQYELFCVKGNKKIDQHIMHKKIMYVGSYDHFEILYTLAIVYAYAE